MVGRAADAPVGLLAPCEMLMSLFRQRDEGVPRGPGGPPHSPAGYPPRRDKLELPRYESLLFTRTRKPQCPVGTDRAGRAARRATTGLAKSPG